jgi:hypothetical protein
VLAKSAKIKVAAEVGHDFSILIWSEETEFKSRQGDAQALA